MGNIQLTGYQDTISSSCRCKLCHCFSIKFIATPLILKRTHSRINSFSYISSIPIFVERKIFVWENFFMNKKNRCNVFVVDFVCCIFSIWWGHFLVLHFSILVIVVYILWMETLCWYTHIWKFECEFVFHWSSIILPFLASMVDISNHIVEVCIHAFFTFSHKFSHFNLLSLVILTFILL